MNIARMSEEAGHRATPEQETAAEAEGGARPAPRVPWLAVVATVAAIAIAFYLAVREGGLEAPVAAEASATGAGPVAPLGSVRIDRRAAAIGNAMARQDGLQIVPIDAPAAYVVSRGASGFQVVTGGAVVVPGIRSSSDAGRDAQRVRNEIYVDVRRRNPSAFTDLSHLTPAVRAEVLDAEATWLDWTAGAEMDWSAYRSMLADAADGQADALIAHERLADYFTSRGARDIGLEQARANAGTHLERVIDLTPKRYGYLMQRARYYLVLELDYKSAHDVLQRGRMRNPDAAPNLLGLLQIAVREGRLAQARSLIEGAQTYLAPRRPVWMLSFARLALVAGEYEKALVLASAVVTDSTEYRTRVEALNLAADAALLSGDKTEARGWLARLPPGLGPALAAAATPVRAALGSAEGVDYEDIQAVAGPYIAARAAAAAGDRAAALSAIKAGLEQRDEHLLDSLRVARFWGPLRTDPEFAVVLGTLTAMETRSAPPGAQAGP